MAILKRKENGLKQVHKVSDIWELYFTMRDERATSIRLDMGIHAYIRRANLVDTYLLSIFYEEQYENGFPMKSSLALLNEVEDKIQQTWGTDDFYLVGVITGQGRREFVFMGDNSKHWNVECKKLMKRYKHTLFTMKVITQDHAAYYETIYPDEYGFDWIKNRQIYQSLKEQGERFEKARNIDFYAYFKTLEQAEEFQKAIQDQFVYVEVSQSEKKDYQVFFILKEIPTLDKMNEVSSEVLRLCRKYEGEFDGWGTTIEK